MGEVEREVGMEGKSIHEGIREGKKGKNAERSGNMERRRSEKNIRRSF